MITAGSYPPISIDFGKDEPGMTLQYRDVKNGYIVWRDVVKDGQVVQKPRQPHLIPSLQLPSAFAMASVLPPV